MQYPLRLGLVCISEMLRDEKKLASRTMTRKSYLSYPREEGLRLLSERILHNTKILQETLRMCARNGIGHYRISSCIFPLVTEKTLNISYDDLPDMDAIRTELRVAGDYARKTDISLSIHPDQFNVLGSYNPNTVENSILELNHQSNMLDMIGCSQDYGTPMCLHLNKRPDLKKETPEQYRERFFTNLKRCNTGVQKRLVLENEDKSYWNCENLFNLFGDRIPLVYDNLHDSCNPSSPEKSWAHEFLSTWGDYRPVYHWSEGIDGSRSHAGMPSHIPEIVLALKDKVSWEVELKRKDYAVCHALKEYVEVPETVC